MNNTLMSKSKKRPMDETDDRGGEKYIIEWNSKEQWYLAQTRKWGWVTDADLEIDTRV